jgi:hypothetical protein
MNGTASPASSTRTRFEPGLVTQESTNPHDEGLDREAVNHVLLNRTP